MKDVKWIKKRGKKISELTAIADLLIEEKSLEPSHHDHKLSGTYEGCRECHIDPDWLLVYRIEGNQIRFIRTGTHSELFE